MTTSTTPTTTNWLNYIDSKLMGFQRRLRDFMIDTPYCAIYGKMSTGKTITTLSALSHIKPPGHTLIVAPKNVARHTWPEEIKQWNIPIKPVSLVARDKKNGSGTTALKRKEKEELYTHLATSKPEICITSWDNLISLINFYQKNKLPWPFYTLVLDESSKISNPQSKSFKALKKIRPYVGRIIELTGSPMANNADKLWAQIYILDQGQALGDTYKKFHTQWFKEKTVVNGNVVEWELASKDAFNDIIERIRPLARSAENTDLQLPAKIEKTIFVQLLDGELETYNTFLEDATLTLVDEEIKSVAYNPHSSESDIDMAYQKKDNISQMKSSELNDLLVQKKSVLITASNRAVLRNKALQFASGTQYKTPYIEKEKTPEQVNKWRWYTKKMQHKHRQDHKIFYREHARDCEHCSADLDNPPPNKILDIKNRETYITSDQKINALRNLIENTTSPMLIAYRYNADRDRIIAEFPEARDFDGSDEMYTAWNNQQIPYMLIHPRSAGHGLNLQHGGNVIVWFNITDSNEEYEQTNARLIRKGSPYEHVYVYKIIAGDTIDEKIPSKLETRTENQQHLIDTLHV